MEQGPADHLSWFKNDAQIFHPFGDGHKAAVSVIDGVLDHGDGVGVANRHTHREVTRVVGGRRERQVVKAGGHNFELRHGLGLTACVVDPCFVVLNEERRSNGPVEPRRCSVGHRGGEILFTDLNAGKEQVVFIRIIGHRVDAHGQFDVDHTVFIADHHVWFEFRSVVDKGHRASNHVNRWLAVVSKRSLQLDGQVGHRRQRVSQSDVHRLVLDGEGLVDFVPSVVVDVHAVEVLTRRNRSLAEVSVLVGDDGDGVIEAEDRVHKFDGGVWKRVALHVLKHVSKDGPWHGHREVVGRFDADNNGVRKQHFPTVWQHTNHVVDTRHQARLVEGAGLDHRAREVTLSGEQSGPVEGPCALENTCAFEGLTDHVPHHDGGRERFDTTAGFNGALEEVLGRVFSTGEHAHRGVGRRCGVVVQTIRGVHEVGFTDPTVDNSAAGPRAVGGVDAISGQLTGVGTGEPACNGHAVGLEGSIFGEGHLTRTLENPGFVAVEGTVVGDHGVVVGVGPDVPKDEGRVHQGFTGERFVTDPGHDTAHTAGGDGHVGRAVKGDHAVGFITADVEVGFTDPRHVRHLSEDGGDLVDGAVVVVFGQDVTEVFGERTVLDAVACTRGFVFADEGAHTDVTCGGKEAVASFVVGVHESDGDPVGVGIEVFSGLAREGVALDEEADVFERLAVVGKGHLPGHFSTGVELEDLDHRVGLSVAVGLRDVVVVVGEDEVVHHRTREGQGLRQEGARRTALTEVLSRLRVHAIAVDAERRCAVTDVGARHHGVEELSRMVGPHVDDLDGIDFCSGLLIQHVLTDRLIHLFAGHLIGECASLGFVDFREEGGRVLTGKDGRSRKDAHGLPAVVLGVRSVASGTGVQTVVHGEVADFMVAVHGFAGCAVVVLHGVGLLKSDHVGVQVHDLGLFKAVDEQLDRHGETGVGTVDVGRNRVELLCEIGGVPVRAKHVVRDFELRVGGEPHVVVEGAVRVFLGGEIASVAAAGQALNTSEDGTALPEAPALIAAGGAVVVELVALRHHGIAVGLNHAEGGVQHLDWKAQFLLFSFDDAGRVRELRSVVDVEQCVVLSVGKVSPQHRVKRRGEGGLVATIGRIHTVAFSELPEPHGREVGFTAGEEHVSGRGDTRLEVVRNRGVVT